MSDLDCVLCVLAEEEYLTKVGFSFLMLEAGNPNEPPPHTHIYLVLKKTLSRAEEDPSYKQTQPTPQI